MKTIDLLWKLFTGLSTFVTGLHPYINTPTIARKTAAGVNSKATQILPGSVYGIFAPYSPAGQWVGRGRAAYPPTHRHSRLSPSVGRENEAAIWILHRTGVHRIELGKSGNVVLGHLDILGEHKPIDGFAARRCREGPLVAVIVSPCWHQPIWIDGSIGRNGWTFLRRHCRDDLAEHCVCLARSHKYPNHCEPAPTCSGVDKVRFHGERLAIDPVFARLMEVELDQPVSLLAKGDGTAFAEIQLDGVPIVDDRVGARFPIKIERGLSRANRLGKIDRRLLSPGRAYFVRCLKTAPVVRSGCSFITPVRTGMCLLSEAGPRAQWAQR